MCMCTYILFLCKCEIIEEAVDRLYFNIYENGNTDLFYLLSRGRSNGMFFSMIDYSQIIFFIFTRIFLNKYSIPIISICK